MQNETRHPAIKVALPSETSTSHRAGSTWRRLPVAVKCVLIVPITMVLLGAEVQLRLCPQLDVILTAAGVWSIWAWLSGGNLPRG